MFKLAQKLYERVKLILPILQSVTDYIYKTPKTNQINNGKNRLACAWSQQNDVSSKCTIFSFATSSNE